MPDATGVKRKLLETEAIVIGYAMSRLDRVYLHRQNCPSWTTAFARAGEKLGIPGASLKNLRDEFDPYHENARSGWHGRALRASRQRVLAELESLSADALLELVERILQRDEKAVAPAIRFLADTERVAHNVAERLLTGRRAEEYFLQHSSSLINIGSSGLIDRRLGACGFDFGVMGNDEQAIEVKGMALLRGAVQFTDLEWSVARRRQENYWLVVVGNLSRKPAARVFRDPCQLLAARSRYQESITLTWHATVSVA